MTDDMDYIELKLWRANRPTHPPVGRQLCALELFSGQGSVTQAFADHRWRVKSIDNSMSSNATTIADIMQLDFDKDVGMVPDFIWASPPCFTYSHLAGKFSMLDAVG
jgi:site-specific DNA-cytosine methylase